jgi:putative transposase
MTNHVQRVVVPERADSLAILFRRVHGRYAQYLNARRRRSGHLWQNRYFSCAVERGHLWQAVRYVELNPVRAGMVAQPEHYRWSSAAAHLAGPESAIRGPSLDWDLWREAGGMAGWRELLGQPVTLNEVVELRRCTYAGKPLGSMEFVAEMESRFGRQWLGRGRPRKAAIPEKGTERSGTISA